MPLSKDPSWQGWGTEKDGSISQTYCSLCYRNGVFCYTGNDVHEFQDIVESEMKKKWYGWCMRKLTRRQIPHLGRWRKIAMESRLNVLSEDLKKLQDKKLWFKRKSYGWGWTPASRQGRLILAVYVCLLVLRTVFYRAMAQEDYQLRAWTELEPYAWGNLLVFMTPVIVLSALLLFICYKTGELPKRQWGPEKE